MVMSVGMRHATSHSQQRVASTWLDHRLTVTLTVRLPTAPELVRCHDIRVAPCLAEGVRLEDAPGARQRAPAADSLVQLGRNCGRGEDGTVSIAEPLLSPASQHPGSSSLTSPFFNLLPRHLLQIAQVEAQVLATQTLHAQTSLVRWLSCGSSRAHGSGDYNQ